MSELTVVGAGLAGSEAAWQAAARGVKVRLCEMRPVKLTEAHKTGSFAELVCSNSLRSADMMSAAGLLKRELQAADSLVMKAAEICRVPAGSALAVDRTLFSRFVTDAVSSHPLIEVMRGEVTIIPGGPAIIATGPLTSSAMAESLERLVGSRHLYFYDAIAPIVDAGSIDYNKVFLASRYGKGGDDYVNCPLSREEYESFLDGLRQADRVNIRDFENEKVFEGCMPVEVMASRGEDTLRFGPMKPVGLRDPRTGREPYAVVQLRPENKDGSAYNMVGFQTRVRWPEQQRVFRMIPGLEKAEFLRFGSVHRNTFINAPQVLKADLSLKELHDTFLAGQITGVEGYLESTAMGLIAGINAARMVQGKEPAVVPVPTAHGALLRHITTQVKNFQPSNINFGLFPRFSEGGRKDLRRKMLVERAMKDWEGYCARVRQ